MTLKTLKWKPTIEASTDIQAGDEFFTQMEAAGFRLPCTLADEDLPVLRGMAAVATTPIYSTLIHLVTMHDSIDLSTD